MYRYTLHFLKSDTGELLPPMPGWTLYSTLGVGSTLVCVWQSPYNSVEVEWGDTTWAHADIPVISEPE